MTIITSKKSYESILGALKNAKKITIVSCGSCAAACQTGGTEGAKEMAEKLQKDGFEIVTTVVPEEVCDNRVLITDFRKIEDQLKNSDAILTLSCGVGAQSIVHVLSKKFPEKPVFIGTNTEFMGETERIGRWYMRCLGCGDCLLNETGGICPITSCAKALMNGPCGGMVDGKCEVGGYEEECGWILIYNRLKQLNRLDLFGKLRDARNWKASGHQRKLVFR